LKPWTCEKLKIKKLKVKKVSCFLLSVLSFGRFPPLAVQAPGRARDDTREARLFSIVFLKDLSTILSFRPFYLPETKNRKPETPITTNGFVAWMECKDMGF
jgi:hypothetical protein